MDLLQLRYFRVVARLENITRAAEELYIAQPSLSQTIARLEESVGVPLFDRQGKRIHLNQYGKVFLTSVDKILNELDEVLCLVGEMANSDRCTVAVGFTTPNRLPTIIGKFLAVHPQVTINMNQIRQHLSLQNMLTKGEIDLSISALPFNYPEIQSDPMAVEEIFLAVKSSHRLAGRKSIQLNDIENERFILLTADYELREIIDNIFQQVGFTPHIAVEGPTPEVICNLVKAGVGITFFPTSWRERVSISSLELLQVGNPLFQQTIWLSWLDKHYQSDEVSEFKQFIIDYYRRVNCDETMA